jgi:hypothetical protein
VYVAANRVLRLTYVCDYVQVDDTLRYWLAICAVMLYIYIYYVTLIV